MSDQQPQICDYEGSTYRTDFWEGRGRSYEDMVERIALRRLLPDRGKRLLEIGAGFGRLTDEYDAYDQVVLLDYSFSQLQYAREKYGDSRYVYVAADIYQLPFKPAQFDGTTMIRVIHHMADVPAALARIRHVMTGGGLFILEHANKRNFKAMLRYLLRRQSWSPYTQEPVEFVKLNYNFHPAYITHQLDEAGFELQQRLPVSFFRTGALKNTLPTGALVRLDSLLQRTPLYFTPSIFTRNIVSGAQQQTPDITTPDALFAAPGTGAPLQREDDTLVCTQTGRRWAIRDGIYDFKEPLG